MGRKHDQSKEVPTRPSTVCRSCGRWSYEARITGTADKAAGTGREGAEEGPDQACAEQDSDQKGILGHEMIRTVLDIFANDPLLALLIPAVEKAAREVTVPKRAPKTDAQLWSASFQRLHGASTLVRKLDYQAAHIRQEIAEAAKKLETLRKWYTDNQKKRAEANKEYQEAILAHSRLSVPGREPNQPAEAEGGTRCAEMIADERAAGAEEHKSGTWMVPGETSRGASGSAGPPSVSGHTQDADEAFGRAMLAVGISVMDSFVKRYEARVSGSAFGNE